MNAARFAPPSPATFERRRARALAAGPSDTAVAAELADLLNDDRAITEAYGWLDTAHYAQIDQLRVTAFRSGDWSAYGCEVSSLIEARLQVRAEEAARQAQERSWNDGAEAVWGRSA